MSGHCIYSNQIHCRYLIVSQSPLIFYVAVSVPCANPKKPEALWSGGNAPTSPLFFQSSICREKAGHTALILRMRTEQTDLGMN